MSSIVTVKNVTKRVNNGNETITILNDVNFRINSNEFVCIMGPSGSGKSTLLSILSGIDRVSSGNVVIDGLNIAKLSDNELTAFRNENIGIIFQSFNLIPSLSAEENILIPLFFSKKDINEKNRVKELLKALELYDKRNLKPRQLSGREQQRIAIARALACYPKILLADEPTGSLDSKNGNMIMDIFKKCNKDLNMTIIMVTHAMDIGRKADRIINLKDGEIR